MENISVRFIDGTIKEYPKGVLLKNLLRESAFPPKSNEVVSAKVDGVLIDLQAPLEKGGTLEWVTLNTGEGTEVLRHSTSHVMAQAVQNLFPEAKITIGPAIKDGFYYDFDLDRSFSPEDFSRIEAKMKEIVERA